VAQLVSPTVCSAVAHSRQAQHSRASKVQAPAFAIPPCLHLAPCTQSTRHFSSGTSGGNRPIQLGPPEALLDCSGLKVAARTSCASDVSTLIQRFASSRNQTPQNLHCSAATFWIPPAPATNCRFSFASHGTAAHAQISNLGAVALAPSLCKSTRIWKANHEATATCTHISPTNSLQVHHTGFFYVP
jgi:hypothetical protein